MSGFFPRGGRCSPLHYRLEGRCRQCSCVGLSAEESTIDGMIVFRMERL